MINVKDEYLVRYYNAWTENKIIHIQMQCISTNLRKFLNEKTNLFSNATIHQKYYVLGILFEQILEAVNYLHEQSEKIVHRNLKPENIMLDLESPNGNLIKLGDCGLAPLQQSAIMSFTQSIATFKYMAPEVMRNKGYDCSADIYSLSVIAQELFDIDINGYVIF